MAPVRTCGVFRGGWLSLLAAAVATTSADALTDMERSAVQALRWRLGQ
jgi:hypothetical protein